MVLKSFDWLSKASSELLKSMQLLSTAFDWPGDDAGLIEVYGRISVDIFVVESNTTMALWKV